MPDRTAEWLQNTRIHQESAAHALDVKDIGNWCLAALVNVDSPRAVAALEAVLELPGDWEKEARRLNNLNQDTKDPQARLAISLRAQAFEDCAAKVREAITTALAAKEAGDGSSSA